MEHGFSRRHSQSRDYSGNRRLQTDAIKPTPSHCTSTLLHTQAQQAQRCAAAHTVPHSRRHNTVPPSSTSPQTIVVINPVQRVQFRSHTSTASAGTMTHSRRVHGHTTFSAGSYVLCGQPGSTSSPRAARISTSIDIHTLFHRFLFSSSVDS